MHCLFYKQKQNEKKNKTNPVYVLCAMAVDKISHDILDWLIAF